MKGLLFERNLPRFAAARVVSAIAGSGRGSAVGPLRLVDMPSPELPGPGWYHVRPILAGICGSDLATLDGRASRYFEDFVSFPFVPGHEVVGLVEGGDAALPSGTRVVLEPVLGCIARDIHPPCNACAEGHTGNCERVAFGHLAPGLQIGYCADTGGGWSKGGLVAHASQLHRVPDSLDDDSAVMVEPTACAVHAALRALEPWESTGASQNSGEASPPMVAVVGSGTLGLTTIAALRHFGGQVVVLAGAKYSHQKEMAIALGADVAVSPGELAREVRRRSRSLVASGHSTSGADVVVDCVGTGESISESLAMVRPRGRVVLVGMPSKVDIDLASLWHREVGLVGAYAYGTEQLSGRTRSTFDLAIELAGAAGIGRLVSAHYPLERFEEAVAHAGAAGRRGAAKIVFDLRAPIVKGPTNEP
jgi:threonine dehydrogenase-like Zn-dependent dehydrogenase